VLGRNAAQQLKFRRKTKGISNKHHNSGVNSLCGRPAAAAKNNKEIKSMKKIFIGALLASAAFAAPALAQTAVITSDQFCSSQRLSAAAQAECRADMTAAVTDAEKARVMDAYESKLGSPPLRNDLRANDAGVKRAEQPTEPRSVESTGVTTVAPATSSSSTTVTVEPRSGASVTTGSSTTVTTSALICADTRLSAKEQDDCSTAMQTAASADEQLSIQKRYEARLANTPLRNDLKSNDAGVKGAVQPATPARPN
jgi:hypothetical protein